MMRKLTIIFEATKTGIDVKSDFESKECPLFPALEFLAAVSNIKLEKIMDDHASAIIADFKEKTANVPTC